MSEKIKPPSMLIAETREAIVNIINNSGLHVGLLEYMIKDIANAVSAEAQKISKQEWDDYYEEPADGVPEEK